MTDESRFYQHRGHRRAEQNVKWALAHTEVTDIAVLLADAVDETFLNFSGQSARLVDLGVCHQVKQNELQVRNLLE